MLVSPSIGAGISFLLRWSLHFPPFSSNSLHNHSSFRIPLCGYFIIPLPKMHSICFLPLFATAILAQNQYTATGVEDVQAAQATARTESPTSNVPGKTFDRFGVIFCENTNFEIAAGDRKPLSCPPNFKADFKILMRIANFAWIAEQGILLTNYHGVVHPSQPNYVAAVGGDLHGVKDSTHVYHIPPDVRTIVDLLEEKKVSWGEYQEDMPYSGFEGNWSPPEKNGKNDYMRKHKYVFPSPWVGRMTCADSDSLVRS